MKAKNSLFTLLAAFAIGGPLVFTPTYLGAQNKEDVDVNVNVINKDGRVHVKIITTENGKAVVKDTTFKEGTLNVEEYIQRNTPAGKDAAKPGEKRRIIIRSDEKVIRTEGNEPLPRPVLPNGDLRNIDSLVVNGNRMMFMQIDGNPPMLRPLEPMRLPQPGDSLVLRKLNGNLPMLMQLDGIDTADMKIMIREEIKSLPDDPELQKMLQERGIEIPEGAMVKKEVRMVFILPAKIEDLNTEDIQQLKKNDVEVFDNKRMLPAEDVLFMPNPNDGRFQLSFNLPEKGRTELRIMDMQGKVVYEEKLGNFQGNYMREIDISKESKGIYLLQVMQGKKLLQKKIVIQK